MCVEVNGWAGRSEPWRGDSEGVRVLERGRVRGDALQASCWRACDRQDSGRVVALTNSVHE